jgi:hypothetical protein
MLWRMLTYADVYIMRSAAHYRQFLQYCSEAYIILRRRAELLINLMMLMKDSNIADISGTNVQMLTQM